MYEEITKKVYIFLKWLSFVAKQQKTVVPIQQCTVKKRKFFGRLTLLFRQNCALEAILSRQYAAVKE